MSKKFILFIVEGKNDEREIDAILHSPYFSKYLELYEPRFISTGGDITTEIEKNKKGRKETNIIAKLNKLVLEFRRSGLDFCNVLPRDIQEIVQIVDMDGAFIPDENVCYGGTKYFEYTDENIITQNVDGAIGRNRKKAEILRKLIQTKLVDNIPYSVYFASCNMDHLLFGNRHLRPYEKNNSAMDFGVKLKEHPERLSESIFKQGIMSEGTYEESWEEIQEDCRSLERRTNINLFLGDGAKNPK